MLIQGQVGPVGPQSIQPGTNPTIRMGQLGDMIVSELHGRFYEQAYRGAFFRTGTTGAAVAGTATMGTATGTSATLATAATGTPMLGVYNPITSTVNAVITQATLQTMVQTATTPIPFNGLVWCVSVGNGGITTGLTPWNSKTLTQTGSQCKGFAGATAVTGLSFTPTAMEAADFYGGGMVTYGTVATTAIIPTYLARQDFDGQLIVPPGGLLALYNTSATTTFSFTGRLLWEEVPL